MLINTRIGLTLFGGILIAALVGCGGGGGGGGGDSASASQANAGGGSPTASTQTVSGTAAFGAPMAGATITLTDADGAKVSTVAAADGSYSLTVTGLTSPFLLTATGVSGDTVKTYSALLATAPVSGAVANVNVTPLTNAIVALASVSGFDPSEFGVSGALKTLDLARLKKAENTILAVLASVIADPASGLPASFNPVTTPFVATLGTPGDRLLETVKVGISDGGVTLTNALAPVVSGATSATATITIKDLATVNLATVAALPKAAALADFNTLLTQMRVQINTCLALAPSDRVTLDASGDVIALKGDCTATKLSAFEATYLNGGLDLMGRWGPRFRDLPKSSSMAQAEVQATFARNDGGTNLVVRLPVNVGLGGTSYNEQLRTDSSGAFKLTGNQRKYDLSIGTRLYRMLDVSSYDKIGGGNDAGKNVGKLSRYETALYANFSLAPTSTVNVYAVRVKGPGLPTSGLVLARSSVCGTGDGLTIYSSDGSLPSVPGGATAPFTATLQSAASWRVSATPIGTEYTGSNLLKEVRGWTTTAAPNPTSSATNYADTPFDVTTIPELAAYDWEVYSVNAAATPELFTTYLIDKPVGAGYANAFPWASVDAGSLDYLKPTTGNPKAGALTDATLSWTTPNAAPLVVWAGLGGSARGSNNQTLRFSTGDTVAPVGATSMKVAPNQETDGLGAACTLATIPPHSATTGNRNLQIEQRGDRVRMIQNWVYSGRTPITPPAAPAGNIGWNVFNADLAPLFNSSIVQADGLLGQFSLNGAPTGSGTYFTQSGGSLFFDTSVLPLTDNPTFRVSNVIDGSATYPKTFTFVTRVTGNSTTTQRAMHFQAALAEPGKTGALVDITIRENNGVNGVSYFNYDGTTASLNSSPINTSLGHIYQVAVTLTSATAGTINVYVDGNSTPVLSQTVATLRPTSTLGDNFFRFGDLSSTVPYVGVLDWVVWTNTGAYTPANLVGKLPTGLGVVTGY